MGASRSTVGGINVLDILDALKRAGVPQRRVCAAAGVDVDALHAPGERVPTALAVRLFEEAGRLSEDPVVGLHAGERAEPRGPLIYVLMSSPSLEEGLRRVAQFSRLVIDTLRVTVDVERDRASVTFDSGDPDFEGSRHAAMYLLS